MAKGANRSVAALPNRVAKSVDGPEPFKLVARLAGLFLRSEPFAATATSQRRSGPR
jgi:hypothetical protein